MSLVLSEPIAKLLSYAYIPYFSTQEDLLRQAGDEFFDAARRSGEQAQEVARYALLIPQNADWEGASSEIFTYREMVKLQNEYCLQAEIAHAKGRFCYESAMNVEYSKKLLVLLMPIGFGLNALTFGVFRKRIGQWGWVSQLVLGAAVQAIAALAADLFVQIQQIIRKYRSGWDAANTASAVLSSAAGGAVGMGANIWIERALKPFESMASGVLRNVGIMLRLIAGPAADGGGEMAGEVIAAAAIGLAQRKSWDDIWNDIEQSWMPALVAGAFMGVPGAAISTFKGFTPAADEWKAINALDPAEVQRRLETTVSVESVRWAEERLTELQQGMRLDGDVHRDPRAILYLAEQHQKHQAQQTDSDHRVEFPHAPVLDKKLSHAVGNPFKNRGVSDADWQMASEAVQKPHTMRHGEAREALGRVIAHQIGVYSGAGNSSGNIELDPNSARTLGVVSERVLETTGGATALPPASSNVEIVTRAQFAQHGFKTDMQLALAANYIEKALAEHVAETEVESPQTALQAGQELARVGFGVDGTEPRYRGFSRAMGVILANMNLQQRIAFVASATRLQNLPQEFAEAHAAGFTMPMQAKTGEGLAEELLDVVHAYRESRGGLPSHEDFARALQRGKGIDPYPASWKSRPHRRAFARVLRHSIGLIAETDTAIVNGKPRKTYRISGNELRRLSAELGTSPVGLPRVLRSLELNKREQEGSRFRIRDLHMYRPSLHTLADRFAAEYEKQSGSYHKVADQFHRLVPDYLVRSPHIQPRDAVFLRGLLFVDEYPIHSLPDMRTKLAEMFKIGRQGDSASIPKTPYGSRVDHLEKWNDAERILELKAALDQSLTNKLREQGELDTEQRVSMAFSDLLHRFNATEFRQQHGEDAGQKKLYKYLEDKLAADLGFWLYKVVPAAEDFGLTHPANASTTGDVTGDQGQNGGTGLGNIGAGGRNIDRDGAPQSPGRKAGKKNPDGPSGGTVFHSGAGSDVDDAVSGESESPAQAEVDAPAAQKALQVERAIEFLLGKVEGLPSEERERYESAGFERDKARLKWMITNGLGNVPSNFAGNVANLPEALERQSAGAAVARINELWGQFVSSAWSSLRSQVVLQGREISRFELLGKYESRREYQGAVNSAISRAFEDHPDLADQLSAKANQISSGVIALRLTAAAEDAMQLDSLLRHHLSSSDIQAVQGLDQPARRQLLLKIASKPITRRNVQQAFDTAVGATSLEVASHSVQGSENFPTVTPGELATLRVLELRDRSRADFLDLCGLLNLDSADAGDAVKKHIPRPREIVGDLEGGVDGSPFESTQSKVDVLRALLNGLGKQRSLEEIAQQLKVTEETVRQLRENATDFFAGRFAGKSFGKLGSAQRYLHDLGKELSRYFGVKEKVAFEAIRALGAQKELVRGFIREHGVGSAVRTLPYVDSRQTEALKSLPDEERRPVILSYYGGFTTNEIAKELRLSASGADTVLASGLTNWERALERQDHPQANSSDSGAPGGLRDLGQRGRSLGRNTGDEFRVHGPLRGVWRRLFSTGESLASGRDAAQKSASAISDWASKMPERDPGGNPAGGNDGGASTRGGTRKTGRTLHQRVTDKLEEAGGKFFSKSRPLYSPREIKNAKVADYGRIAEEEKVPKNIIAAWDVQREADRLPHYFTWQEMLDAWPYLDRKWRAAVQRLPEFLARALVANELGGFRPHVPLGIDYLDTWKSGTDLVRLASHEVRKSAAYPIKLSPDEMTKYRFGDAKEVQEEKRVVSECAKILPRIAEGKTPQEIAKLEKLSDYVVRRRINSLGYLLRVFADRHSALSPPAVRRIRAEFYDRVADMLAIESENEVSKRAIMSAADRAMGATRVMVEHMDSAGILAATVDLNPFLEKVIRQMDEPHRTVAVLHEVCGLTTKEIAAKRSLFFPDHPGLPDYHAANKEVINARHEMESIAERIEKDGKSRVGELFRQRGQVAGRFGIDGLDGLIRSASNTQGADIETAFLEYQQSTPKRQQTKPESKSKESSVSNPQDSYGHGDTSKLRSVTQEQLKEMSDPKLDKWLRTELGDKKFRGLGGNFQSQLRKVLRHHPEYLDVLEELHKAPVWTGIIHDRHNELSGKGPTTFWPEAVSRTSSAKPKRHEGANPDTVLTQRSRIETDRVDAEAGEPETDSAHPVVPKETRPSGNSFIVDFIPPHTQHE